MGEDDPDLHELEEAVTRLRDLNPDSRLLIEIESRRRGPFVVQGIVVSDLWTDVFEPFRRRVVFGRRWQLRQTVADVERSIAWFLTNRPDRG
ncbi:MAG TPA: hypothetical protein VGL05_22875 [Kribbella sp.]